MTKIKLCGLKRDCDIDFANRLMPDYIGFVFAERSRRYISPDRASELRVGLSDKITPTGVFVNEKPQLIAEIVSRNIIGAVQLHGSESNEYIKELKKLVTCPIIKAFRIDSAEDIRLAEGSAADLVMLDAGVGGTGTTFDWSLIGGINRSYFLAGGLDGENVHEAVERLHPYAVDVSSGIETDGFKDYNKMKKFSDAVRGIN